MSDFNICPQCNAQVPLNYLYCNECGFMMGDEAPVVSEFKGEEDWNIDLPMHESISSSIDDAPQPSLVAQSALSPAIKEQVASQNYVPAPLFDLHVVRSAHLEELNFPIHHQSIVGRVNGNILFKEDPYVSPTHATFFYDQHQLFVKDESSFNGIFIRLKNMTALQPGDFFIAGEQFFQVEPVSENKFSIFESNDPSDKNTKYFASNSKHFSRLNLVQWLEGGQRGLSVPITENNISIGRQGCDLNFPLDRFMSSHHCHISLDQDRVFLTDLGSRNGTFIQVKGVHAVNLGDFILIGKQLLQIKPHVA